MVITDHVRRHVGACIGGDLRRMRLDHQIPDGENKAAVVDDDAGAFALAAEIADGASIRINERLDAHHRSGKVRERHLLSEGCSVGENEGQRSCEE